MQKMANEVLEHSSSHTPSSHLFWLLLLFIFQFSSVSSVAQSCPTLCDPKDCSTPGFSVRHQLQRACSSSCPSSHPLSFPSLPAFNLSQHQSRLFTLGGQGIGASMSVLSVTTQDWFPLWLTGLISLQSICSDFGAHENKVSHCFRYFPSYLPWSDETRCHDLHFSNVEF